MSVQAGISFFDGRKASWEDVHPFIDGLEERGPDYSDIRESGPVGFGFRGFLIAPEDDRNQPFENKRGDIITFDGRLDCRQDLAGKLGLPAATKVSDVELVLLGYERFGESLFEKLMGEFALVLWDCGHRSLFLVRSLCGTRPLFYIHDSHRVIWSSELDILVIRSGIEPIVNDAYAIGFAYYQPDIDQSPFANVSVVPPGTYLEIKHSGEVRAPVATWLPERVSTLTLPTDGDYEEAWRHEVQAAIANRLRVRGPVWCELSGGLDSSTVALIADRVLKSSGQDPMLLTTVSCTFETSTDCDETPFISAVEDVRGRKGFHINEGCLAETLVLDRIAFTARPNTLHLFPGRYQTIQQLMNDAGCRVLLTGNGGDELFWSDYSGSPELADLLATGRLLAMVSAGRKWSRIAATSLWQVILKHALEPLRGSNRFLNWESKDDLFPPWTTPKARMYLNRPGLRLGLHIDTAVWPPSRRLRVLSVRSSRAVLCAGYHHEYHGIFFSHPFLNQTLTDFMLSLPMNQIARPGETRSLMRRASRGMLPDKTRLRKSKGALDTPFLRLLSVRYRSIGDTRDFRVCQRGYAEPQEMSAAINRCSLGRGQYSMALSRVLCVERWLRSLEVIAPFRSNTTGCQSLATSEPFNRTDSPEASILTSGCKKMN